MSKSNAFENAFLLLYFNATPIANIADNAGTAPATDITVALHTGDPGEAGDMSTNEATYTSYARVTVVRSGAGWTVTGNSCSPAADISFAQATGGSETITHFSVGSGVGNNLGYSGTVTPNIVVSNGVQPVLDVTSTITED